MLASKIDKEKVFNFKQQWFNYTNYTPHNGQNNLHFPNKTARFIVAICGRRWGKSVAASKEIEVMLNIPNTRSWVVAPTYQTAEKVFREVWHSIVQNRDPKKMLKQEEHHTKICILKHLMALSLKQSQQIIQIHLWAKVLTSLFLMKLPSKKKSYGKCIFAPLSLIEKGEQYL